MTESKKLGEILLDEGEITENQLETALEKQHTGSARYLGSILVEMGAIDDEAVAHGIAMQLGLPYVNPLRHPVDPSIVVKVPRDMAESHRLLPLVREDLSGAVLVAMADPRDQLAIQNLGALLRATIKPLVASSAAIQQAIHRHYDLAPEARKLLSGVTPDQKPPTLTANTLELDADAIRSHLRGGGQKPYIQLVNYLLMNAIERRASDIHLEPEADGLRVRFRIDGLLREVLRLPPFAEQPIISRLKVVGELDIAVRKRAQEGKVNVSVGPKKVDLRISIVPSAHGERAVVRILDSDMLASDLASMGWQPSALSSFYRMVSQPQGIVLVVGPTGSGKSTTLYATISRLRAESTSIVTIEDPVEYTIPGISQIQVDEVNGLSFSQSVKALLRQDPDVMVIGEIRDRETATAAVEAATTGHLVLSTLHTVHAISSVTRLHEIGVPPYLVGATLLGIVAQRLVRVVCKECSYVGAVDDEDWFRLGIRPMSLGESVRRAGPGCPRCDYAGYSGRTGVFEVLTVTDEMRSLITDRAREPRLWEAVRSVGHSSLLDDALVKVWEGITTMQEVARVVPVDPWRDERRTIEDVAKGLAHRARKPLWSPAEMTRTLRTVEAKTRTQTAILKKLTVSEADTADIKPPSRADSAVPRSDSRSDSALPRFDSATNSPGSAPRPSEPPPFHPSQPPPSSEFARVALASPAGSPSTPPPLEGFGGEKPRVLAVDDAEEIVRLIKITLEDDYNVETAGDGESALLRAKAWIPDAVILDVMMPKMSGYDVCAELKKTPETAHIPILMLSARGEKQHVARGFYAGADDYLPKPFDPEELALRLRAILRRSRAAHQHTTEH